MNRTVRVRAWDATGAASTSGSSFENNAGYESNGFFLSSSFVISYSHQDQKLVAVFQCNTMLRWTALAVVATIWHPRPTNGVAIGIDLGTCLFAQKEVSFLVLYPIPTAGMYVS